MKTFFECLYIAWVIATKDFLDALKNKSSRANIIIMLLMVVFFYWLSELRPFDKKVSVVVYDESSSTQVLDTTRLADGSEYSFRQANSFQDMEEKMANQDLGLVLPANFDQILGPDGNPTLNGYIFWVDRNKVTGLETKYSQAFSDILGRPVQVVLGDHILIPLASVDGSQTNVTYLMVYFVFTTALLLIPHLMVEEKQTKTLDALMISPATPGQIVGGKALAGLFYILLIGGLALALFSRYIVNWALALTTFLGYALMAIGLGLLVGSYIKSMKQSGAWMLVLALVLMVPPLFYSSPNLKEGIRLVFTWVPTSALASLLRFSCSRSYSLEQILTNLAVVIISIGIVYSLVIWKVRRYDR